MVVVGSCSDVKILDDGSTMFVRSEPLQQAVPPFKFYLNDSAPVYQQQDLYVVGVRVAQVWFIGASTRPAPLPILLRQKNYTKLSAPSELSLLTDTTQVFTLFDSKTQKITAYWWWQAWTPTSLMPQPPKDRYKRHSVPSVNNPAWLGSLAPNANPGIFATDNFWIAPIPSSQSYDLFTNTSPAFLLGEPVAGTNTKVPGSPAAIILKNMIDRSLIEFPPPPENPFGTTPTIERDNWERRGGIVAAGQHLKLAAGRDTPVWVSYPQSEGELSEIPGADTSFPDTTNWNDHLIICNALTAHFDYANMSLTTRVLMRSTGEIISGSFRPESKPGLDKPYQTPTIHLDPYPVYPSKKNWGFQGRTIILDHPQVVAVIPGTTNYRQVVNPTTVSYPVLGNPDTVVYSHHDGFLGSTSTPHVSNEHMVDYLVGEHHHYWAQKSDLLGRHLDNRSF